ncbi:MAG TPA: sugar ABC transporter permease [Candidatus Limiplasma sp.]|nr:sugar ABC transporter permease [Candidatus Limiplasma sp.]
MTNWNGISRKITFIQFKNYVNIFNDKRFLNALIFNAKYCVMLTICIVILGIILAHLLNSKIKGITFFRSMYFLPAVLSMITVGLIFNQIYYRAIPPIGSALGIEFLSKNILSSPKTAVYGILFVNVWQGVAMPTLLFLAGLQTVPAELYEAAAMDGVNTIQRFLHITLPFLIPVLSVVMVLTIKGGITVFDYVKSLTDGGPGGVTESVSLLIYSNAFVEMKFSYAVAEAIVIGVVIALISAVQIFISGRKKV